MTYDLKYFKIKTILPYHQHCRIWRIFSVEYLYAKYYLYSFLQKIFCASKY